MAGGFIAFRCSNYETTAEREQFRLLCKKMKSKYFKSEHFYLLVANYNIFDSELDAIVIKNDAIVAIEFKNYGGNIVATENGDWTANGVAIKGGSRKTVYQQARINHASLRNGLKELGINNEWIKDIPSLIVFNKPITLDNHLSGKVQSWLHITDNAHFIEKIEDITSGSTNLSNLDIINLAISLNLNSFIVPELSSYSYESSNDSHAEPSGEQESKEVNTPTYSPSDNTSTEESQNKHSEVLNQPANNILKQYDRFTPNHIFSLRPNQIFVFGTDKKGSQKYGAAGLAAKKFGAKFGVVEGKTGDCYALPTKGFSINDLQHAVTRFKDFVDANNQFIYLITPVGCGHAGFNVSEVAKMFEPFITYSNVWLPKIFIDEFLSVSENSLPAQPIQDLDNDNLLENETIKALKLKLSKEGKIYNASGSFTLTDGEGSVIAEAELGLIEEKIVFLPFNIQSELVFKSSGYKIVMPEAYLNN